MKRMLNLFFVTILLWCAVAIYIEAGVNMYSLKGIDAREATFHVSLSKDPDVYSVEELTIDQIVERNPDGDLRYMNGKLRVGDIYFRSLPDFNHPESYRAGQLNNIMLRVDDSLYINIFANLYEYPEDGKRTLFSDLLDTKTTMIAIDKLQSIVDEYGITEEACDIIKAELEKEYSPLPPPAPAWVLPTAICGGAVVLAAAVAVPTVILRRKKRIMAADGDTAEAEGV